MAGLGWKGGSAPWRRQRQRPGPRVLRWVVSGCRLVPRRARDCPSSSSLSLRRPPLCHRCRGCPISAAGTGARDVTLRAPPAQSPPPVLAARPPARLPVRPRGRCGAARRARGARGFPCALHHLARVPLFPPGSREAQQVTTPCLRLLLTPPLLQASFPASLPQGCALLKAPELFSISGHFS